MNYLVIPVYSDMISAVSLLQLATTVGNTLSLLVISTITTRVGGLTLGMLAKSRVQNCLKSPAEM